MNMKYKFIPAVNYTPVPKQLIVIHWIVGTAKGCHSYFQNPDVRASYHYVIDQDAEVTQMVLEKDIAWHAGVSSLPGYPTMYNGVEWDSLNPGSIGIGCEGPPSYIKGMKSWNKKMIRGLADLCKDISTRHPGIKITDHSTISPKMKIDVRGSTGKPEDVFPWETFMYLTGMEEA
jgi:N-acetyl-anhydromuramyl-L-alanine amidase AmpD